MKTEHVDLDSFANALAADVQGRHLMVWSDVPSTEAGLGTLDAAGTLTTAEPDRTFHVAVENSTSDKLDYFVRVGLSMRVTVDPTGTALINTTINVANNALPGQPPSYQYGPDDINAFTPGQYVARVFFWGPTGSILPGSTPESGLLLTQSHFSLLPGGHDSVTFATVIPHAVVNGHLQPAADPPGPAGTGSSDGPAACAGLGRARANPPQQSAEQHDPAHVGPQSLRVPSHSGCCPGCVLVVSLPQDCRYLPVSPGERNDSRVFRVSPVLCFDWPVD